jgi:hypothetical protein
MEVTEPVHLGDALIARCVVHLNVMALNATSVHDLNYEGHSRFGVEVASGILEADF